ncbi:MAG TPA: redoxin domain-containing protein [Nitrososphaeraceae archaeon]|nr:redoxin domain-containing protein [Nitrososphaeraceae archaeon]
MVSDSNHQISKKYGVYTLKKFMDREYTGVNRTTLLIDKHGKIVKIFDKVKPKGHSEEVLKYFLKDN